MFLASMIIFVSYLLCVALDKLFDELSIGVDTEWDDDDYAV